jgi:uncharacterized protein (TIGR04551 family)
MEFFYELCCRFFGGSMRRFLPGAVGFCLFSAASPGFSQTSLPTQPTSVPSSLPVEPPKLTPKGLDDVSKGLDDPGFNLVERTFPEEIHAKRFQFFQLDGYFRMRGDQFRRPDLGLAALNGGEPLLGPNNLPILGLPVPLEDNPENAGLFGGKDRYSSSNMRLRLEPVFNASENVRVHIQADVLDNVILGSTPTAFPEVGGISPSDLDVADFFGSSQVPVGDTIRIKRAWAEAKIPYGEVRFGRMGWHFGTGILSNDGNDLDSDFGDTVDRVAFTTKLSDYLLTAAYDWGQSGFSDTPVGTGGLGQAVDASQQDDLQQFLVSGMRFYTREEEEKLRKRGKLVLQYGLQSFFRRQSATSEFAPAGQDPNTVVLADRNAFSVHGDLWGKIVWKDLRVEAEFVGLYGKIECITNTQPGAVDGGCLDPAGPQAGSGLEMLAGGFVIKGDYALSKGQWHIGGEIGAASGDEQSPYSLSLQNQTELNVAENARLTNFLFDRDYHVDLIMFRELLGTVNNALYVKPVVTFAPFPQLTLNATSVVSFLLKHNKDHNEDINAPLNPEDKAPLGVELDVDGEYRTDDGFFAGISWGVLVPLDGLNGTDIDQKLIDAKTAQAFRLRLGVSF